MKTSIFKWMSLSLVAMFCCATICTTACYDCQAGTPICAYLLCRDSHVWQFSSDDSGKFQLLEPAITDVGKIMAADSKGRFVYITSEDNLRLRQYEITSSGKLRLVRQLKGNGSNWISDIMIDHADQHLFVLTGSGTLTCYAIGGDGSLRALGKQSVGAEGCTDYIAKNTSKPHVYLISTYYPVSANTGLSDILQYTVGHNHKLSPLTPAKLSYDYDLWKMVFSHDGKFAYANSRGSSLLQFRIGNNGALQTTSRVSYKGYLDEDSRYQPDSWVYSTSGQRDVLVAPSGVSLIVCDHRWGGLYKFDLGTNGKPIYDDCYYVEQDRLVGEKDIRIRAEVAVADDTKYTLRAYKKITSGLGLCHVVTSAPDGVIYGVEKNTIIRFRISSSGKIESLESAFNIESTGKVPASELQEFDQPSRFIIVQRTQSLCELE